MNEASPSLEISIYLSVPIIINNLFVYSIIETEEFRKQILK